MLGFFLGILPGGGTTLSPLAAYSLEKRRSKTPERFGEGAVEGVAAPESADNAAATSSFIPRLTLGIPANSTTAVTFGALLLHGVTPGPRLVEDDPELFRGVALGYLVKELGSDPGRSCWPSCSGRCWSNLRRSLLIFEGDPTGFRTRPISGTLLAVFLLVVLGPLLSRLLARRRASSHRPAKEPV